MDLEGIMLCEIRQRQIMYGFIYMWNLKKPNEQQQQQKAGIIDTENKKGLPEGKRKEIGEGDLKVQTWSCKINVKEIKCSALTV